MPTYGASSSVCRCPDQCGELPAEAVGGEAAFAKAPSHLANGQRKEPILPQLDFIFTPAYQLVHTP